MIRTLSTLLIICFSLVAQAEWQLVNEQSYVGFASVKNDLVAENHHFKSLSGSVSDAGEVTVSIDLGSVETLIPIRNERMQNLLFDVTNFAKADISTQVDLVSILADGSAASRSLDIDMVVDLHGHRWEKTVPVRLTKVHDGDYIVSSEGSIMIHASQFALADGVEALRRIAGLQSIDLMVPVTFSLRFEVSP